jgi:trehalose/maltose hydrolase-like predicted phosphorylase
VPQFDGYLALRDVPVTELLARKLHPHEYLGGGNGLAVPTQVIKQADVVLGLALLPDELAREDRRASWEYYEPRTEHGSSLSACAYALVAAEIGRGDEAYRYFMKAATIDRDGASKSHVGTLYIGGTHPASNGGAWMAAIMGLCGVRVAERTLVVEPRLPERWTAVTLPLTVHGWHLRLTVGHHQVRIEGERASEEELCVQIEGKMYPLGRQAYLTVPLSDYARRSFSQNIAPGSGLAQ